MKTQHFIRRELAQKFIDEFPVRKIGIQRLLQEVDGIVADEPLQAFYLHSKTLRADPAKLYAGGKQQEMPKLARW